MHRQTCHFVWFEFFEFFWGVLATFWDLNYTTHRLWQLSIPSLFQNWHISHIFPASSPAKKTLHWWHVESVSLLLCEEVSPKGPVCNMYLQQMASRRCIWSWFSHFLSLTSQLPGDWSSEYLEIENNLVRTVYLLLPQCESNMHQALHVKIYILCFCQLCSYESPEYWTERVYHCDSLSLFSTHDIVILCFEHSNKRKCSCTILGTWTQTDDIIGPGPGCYASASALKCQPVSSMTAC